MYIGLDIGGSKINSVLMDGNRIFRQKKVLVKSVSNKKIMLAQIFDCIEFLLSGVDRKRIKGIGIGVPAPVNVTALKDVSLTEIVRRKFRIKTKVDNDANCFGLAEAILGAGKNYRIVAGLTLGTGVGGALIIDKKIFGRAEFGHMIIEKGGRKCNCGNRGCLEAYISANISAKEKAEYLRIGVMNIVNILDPDIVVVGGGLANIITLPSIKNTKIVRPKLGENAGAIGAALLFRPQVIHRWDLTRIF